MEDELLNEFEKLDDYQKKELVDEAKRLNEKNYKMLNEIDVIEFQCYITFKGVNKPTFDNLDYDTITHKKSNEEFEKYDNKIIFQYDTDYVEAALYIKANEYNLHIDKERYKTEINHKLKNELLKYTLDFQKKLKKKQKKRTKKNTKFVNKNFKKELRNLKIEKINGI